MVLSLKIFLKNSVVTIDITSSVCYNAVVIEKVTTKTITEVYYYEKSSSYMRSR